MNKQNNQNENALLVRPGMHPKRVAMGLEYQDLCAVLGASTEITFPFNDPVGLVCAVWGKLSDETPCRGLRTPDGKLYDVICGPFLLVGLHDGELCALTPEMMDKYEKLFYQPVVFVSAGGVIMEIPVEAIPDAENTG